MFTGEAIISAGSLWLPEQITGTNNLSRNSELISGIFLPIKNLLISLFLIHSFFGESQLIKNYGVGFSIGSGISPTGMAGAFGTIGFLPNTMIVAGGSILPGKFFVGAAHQFNVTNKFLIEPGSFYQRLGAYSLVFEEDSDNERFYNYSAAQFVSPALTFKWKIDSMMETNDPEYGGFMCLFLRLGYTHRFSKYSISPTFSDGKSFQEDRDKMYHRNFNNDFYWNIGIQLFLTRKKRSNP